MGHRKIYPPHGKIPCPIRWWICPRWRRSPFPTGTPTLPQPTAPPRLQSPGPPAEGAAHRKTIRKRAIHKKAPQASPRALKRRQKEKLPPGGAAPKPSPEGRLALRAPRVPADKSSSRLSSPGPVRPVPGERVPAALVSHAPPSVQAALRRRQPISP